MVVSTLHFLWGLIMTFGVSRDWYAIAGVILISFCISTVFFLFVYGNENYHMGSLVTHGEVGCNMARYGVPKLNSDRIALISNMQVEKGHMVDFSDVENISFGPPDRFIPINDTIGYGIILGCLWKLTGSLWYLHVQVLQIILYLLCLPLIYRLSKILFGSDRVAFLSMLLVGAFFPLMYMNIHPVRDVWAFYGLVVLLNAVVGYLSQRLAFIAVVLSSIFCAIAQWIRPTLFGPVSAVLFVILSPKIRKRAVFLVVVFGVVNILFFWTPFIYHNQVAYGRSFVGPVGQDLWQGVGRFENKFGCSCSDPAFGRMLDSNNLEYGTPEGDDKGEEVALSAIKDDPIRHLKNMFSLIPEMICPLMSAVPQGFPGGGYS